jgi:hypothetical protein
MQFGVLEATLEKVDSVAISDCCMEFLANGPYAREMITVLADEAYRSDVLSKQDKARLLRTLDDARAQQKPRFAELVDFTLQICARYDSLSGVQAALFADILVGEIASVNQIAPRRGP